MHTPFKVFTHYSIKHSTMHVLDYTNTSLKLGHKLIFISDINSLSGVPEMFQTVEKYNKKNKTSVIPVAGCCFLYKDDLSSENFEKIFLYARNKNGYTQLVSLLSEIRSDNENLQEVLIQKHITKLFTDDLVCITDKYLQNIKDVFKNYLSVENDLHNSLFKNGVYYLNESDKILLQIITLSRLKLTIEDQNSLIETNPSLKYIFDNTRLDLTQENNLDNDPISQIENLFSAYSIESRPQIPNYIDENNKTIENPDEYLTELCRKGWVSTGIFERVRNDPKLKQVYADRVKEELSVIKMAGIANYFLLVLDFVLYSRKQGYPVAGLRGSAAGSLVFYLIGVTKVDPVIPDPTCGYDPLKSLIFSRFINKGRFSEGRFSLPDADIDLPPVIRDSVKVYIKNKYGFEKVSNIITFNKMKGSNTLKEVFRVLNKSFDVANNLTKNMIEEAKVQDELEEYKEDNPKYNIINYCIENIPVIRDAYQDFKYEFDIAIQLTDTITHEGVHAAGLVIANQELKNFIPTKIDREHNILVSCYKMQDIEYVGGVKMDLLSVLAYQKITEMLGKING